tara:strand:- start:6 stop:452 length:447 start_codon:yes stop_codon:yes gene_type:complete
MKRKITESQIDTWGKLLRIHSNSTVAIESALSQNEQISLIWYDVLLVVSKAPKKKLRFAEIADRIVLTRSGLSRCIANLEKKGYLKREKCEEDKRGAFAILTNKGKKALKSAWPIYRNKISETFIDRLNGEEIKQLDEIFDKILGLKK